MTQSPRGVKENYDEIARLMWLISSAQQCTDMRYGQILENAGINYNTEDDVAIEKLKFFAARMGAFHANT